MEPADGKHYSPHVQSRAPTLSTSGDVALSCRLALDLFFFFGNVDAISPCFVQYSFCTVSTVVTVLSASTVVLTVCDKKITSIMFFLF